MFSCNTYGPAEDKTPTNFQQPVKLIKKRAGHPILSSSDYYDFLGSLSLAEYVNWEDNKINNLDYFVLH